MKVEASPSVEAWILWNESKRQPQANSGQGSDSLVSGWLGKDWRRSLEFQLWPKPASACSPPQPEPCLDSQPRRLFLFQPSSSLHLHCSDGDSLERTRALPKRFLCSLPSGCFSRGRGGKRHSLCYEKWVQKRNAHGGHTYQLLCGWRQLWKQLRQVTFS